MRLNINPDWLRKMAEKEDDGFISVGGLVTRMEKEDAQTLPTLAEWSKVFPVRMMKKLKFSLPEGVSDATALLQFFGVPSLEAWQAKWNGYSVAFRQTQKFDARREAVAAWVREAEIIASQIPLVDFDEAKLRAMLDDLRQGTRLDTQAGLDQAQLLCAKAGVALVLVPELPGTRLSGCARWLDDKHAMVGLTVRYKWADQLWYTFFHEIGHILLHRPRRTFVIDNAADNMGDGVVDQEMTRYEEEADGFARDTLIPPAAIAGFLRRYGETLTNEEVHGFADSVGVSPAIVVGRLQHDGNLQHWQGNKLRQKLEQHFVTED